MRNYFMSKTLSHGKVVLRMTSKKRDDFSTAWFMLLIFKRIWVFACYRARMGLCWFCVLQVVGYLWTSDIYVMDYLNLMWWFLYQEKQRARRLIKIILLFIWLSLLIYFIDKSYKYLDLIHHDIYSLKFVQAKDCKKYFIILFDD
jgi:hypothetical protein